MTGSDSAGGVLGLLSYPQADWLGQRLPRPLVFTHGVFDLLHAGHIDCLEAARSHGRALVVGLRTDASARRLHTGGTGRPIQPQHARARVLAGLRAVSAVVLFDEAMPLRLIEALRPELCVEGGGDDGEGDGRAAAHPEAALVAHWGGRMLRLPRTPGLSGAALVQRVLDVHAPALHAAPALQSRPARTPLADSAA